MAKRAPGHFQPFGHVQTKECKLKAPFANILAHFPTWLLALAGYDCVHVVTPHAVLNPDAGSFRTHVKEGRRVLGGKFGGQRTPYCRTRHSALLTVTGNAAPVVLFAPGATC